MSILTVLLVRLLTLTLALVPLPVPPTVLIVVPHGATVTCHGLAAPDPSRVIRPFAPVGRWAGHWGIDLATPEGSAVPAIGAGVVSFSDRVVDTIAVTVDHGGGIRTSYSYLASVSVRRGQRIRRGQRVGMSGVHDGRPAFHLSLRLGAAYLDPMVLHRCRTSPWGALYLETSAPYPAVDVRDPRRHVRPPALRPPGAGERRRRAARRRRGPTGACG